MVILVLCIGLSVKNKTNTLNSNSIKEGITKELDENLIGAYIQNGEDYTPTSDIPTSGYEFNEEKSYCKIGDVIQDGTTISYDIATQTLTVSPITKEGMKCYLYFDENASGSEIILAQEGGAETIEAKETPDFSKTATTDEGMFAAEDDYGTSYYYRGAVNDNWFQFGTNSSGQLLYWRIIRINGDGSIRLIYNGTSTTTTENDTMINVSQTFNSSDDNNMYVGYMYQSNKVHGLQTNSDIKKVIDNWYVSNLADEAKYLDGDAGFCGDRTSTTSSSGAPNDTGGTGTTETYYGARYRLYKNKTPSFKCSDKDNDLYTISGSSEGNGALTQPIGLISADEVAFAGGVHLLRNSSYYLYNNAYYWIMSPSYNNSFSGAFVFTVRSDGAINFNFVSNSWGVRPVINLKSDVSLTGSGTVLDPFKVVGAD